MLVSFLLRSHSVICLVEFYLIWALRMWKLTSVIKMWKNFIGASQQESAGLLLLWPTEEISAFIEKHHESIKIYLSCEPVFLHPALVPSNGVSLLLPVFLVKRLPEKGPATGSIIGGIIAVILVLAIVGTAIAMYRKHRDNKLNGEWVSVLPEDGRLQPFFISLCRSGE